MGTDTFWSDSSTGDTGTLTAATTNADNLIIAAGTTGTTGTITVDTTQSANSITFDDNVASTLSGGSAVVPEPGTLGLLLIGALGVLNRRRRWSWSCSRGQ